MERFEAGSRGIRDAASMLPFFSIVLFVPPIVLIFAKPSTLLGIPVIVVYLFAVWAGVIAAAFLFSLRLGKPGQKPPHDDGTG